jgi:CRP-like cAMP-binding protein
MRFQNTLLNAFGTEVVSRLGLKPIQLELRHEIERQHRPITHLYFLETGMASMTATFQDGSQIEIGTFGYESVIGLPALMGTRESLHQVYTQIAGHGYTCTVDSAKREFARGGRFQTLALRYVQAQLVQAGQSIGCNAKHKVQPRLARWMLICADRSHSDTFRVSHDLLAYMVGGTRATVSLAAGALKRKDLIAYSRGRVTILDRPALEKNACECYQTIRGHLKNLAEFDTPMVE